jgi:hypothetical protein
MKQKTVGDLKRFYLIGCCNRRGGAMDAAGGLWPRWRAEDRELRSLEAETQDQRTGKRKEKTGKRKQERGTTEEDRKSGLGA